MAPNLPRGNIRRMVRRETLYKNSSNPFRNKRRGFDTPRTGDIQDRDGPETINVYSELPPRTSSFSNEGVSSASIAQRQADSKNTEITSNIVVGSKTEQSGQDISKLQRASRMENTARQRFISKFHKNEDGPEAAALDSISVKHKRFTIGSQFRATLLQSWMNLLLLAVPAGFVVYYMDMNPIAVFFVNFAAIFPLNGIFTLAIDEVRLRTSLIGGILIYMSLGNLVLFVTSILLLRSGQVSTLKTSIIGNILTTNLLNTGIAFFFGGLRRTEQFFNVTVVHTMNLLLLVTIVALILPTASALLSQTPVNIITKQSRGAAVILIVIYILYLYFEFVTHNNMFLEESRKVAMRPRRNVVPDGAVAKGLAVAGGLGAGIVRGGMTYNQADDHLMDVRAYEKQLQRDAADNRGPQLHIYVCIATLIIGTTILAFNTKFMTDSIEGLVTEAGVPRDFIGIILLPILSNDLAAIQLAVKDQMDVAIHAALGKSLQATLLVTPVLVLVGWGLQNDDMNLYFDGFQVVALFASVLSVQTGILDGKSNWLIGATFVLIYVMIGIASWFQGPDS